MIFILKNNFKENTPIVVGLTKFMGVGKEMAKQICDQLGFSQRISFNQLSESQLNSLKETLDQNYLIASALQLFIKNRKTRLSSISAYRGFRHSRGLPSRGQRTHGNARTCRKQHKFFKALHN